MPHEPDDESLDDPDACCPPDPAERELTLSDVGSRLIHELEYATQRLELLDHEPSLSSGTRDAMVGVRRRLADLVRDLQLYVAAGLAETKHLDADVLMNQAQAWLRERGGGDVRITPSDDWGEVVGDEQLLVVALGHALAWLVRRTPSGSVQLAAWSNPVRVGFSLTGYEARPTAQVASSRVERETGLECAIADRIARAHGGDLLIAHDPDAVQLTLSIGRAPAARAR